MSAKNTSSLNDFADRLKEAMGDMSPEILAKHLDISANSIRNYLKRIHTPQIDTALKLSEICNVDPGWLILGKSLEEGKEPCATTSGGYPFNNSGRCVDIEYYEQQVDSSYKSQKEHYNVSKILQISCDFLEEIFGSQIPDLKLIEAFDNSMEPTIKPGDKLLIDQRPRRLSGIFLIDIDGDLFVKRLLTATDHIKVISDNKIIPSFNVLKEAVHWEKSSNKNSLRVVGYVACCMRTF